MAEAVLMYGIGATKAGTSWLHRYLEGHPECIMPPIKELHYFDMVEDGNYNGKIGNAQRLVQDLTAKLDNVTAQKKHEIRQRIGKIDRWLKVLELRKDAPGAYAAYLLDQARGAKLTADITPAYSMLPTSRLMQMAALAPVTRFVYILRDPVERLWANIRMNAKRKSGQIDLMREFALQEVDDILQGNSSPALDRSDYAAGLRALEKAVPASDRKVLFYENLFCDEAIRALCAFLGLGNHKAQLQQRVHTGVSIDLDRDRRARLQDLLAPQYRAVEQRFQTLPARWQDNMARV